MDNLLAQIRNTMAEDTYCMFPLPREYARAAYERTLEMARQMECPEDIALIEDADGMYLRVRPSRWTLLSDLQAKIEVWDDHITNTDSLPIESWELMGYTPYEAVRILAEDDPDTLFGWLPAPHGVWLGNIVFARGCGQVDSLDWVIDAEGIAWLENGSVSTHGEGGVCE